MKILLNRDLIIESLEDVRQMGLQRMKMNGSVETGEDVNNEVLTSMGKNIKNISDNAHNKNMRQAASKNSATVSEEKNNDISAAEASQTIAKLKSAGYL